MSDVDAATVARVFREEYGRCVATLVRRFGDIDAAEDAVQEAFDVALRRWPVDGLPSSPGAWITTTARNRAIDRARRTRRGEQLTRDAVAGTTPEEDVVDERAITDGPVTDDELSLVFTCCHPALSLQARVALTLRLVGGLTTAEIAGLFLTSTDAMTARLTRAKAKIRDAVVPYRVPGPADVPTRLDGVLAVVYLLHTSGVDLPAGDERGDAFVREARRLAELLVRLLPDEGEPLGLLALLLLSAARRPARHAGDGSLVLLADQDRTAWDHALVRRGLALVDECIERDRLGRYQLQAIVQALHAAAPDVESTDWRRIVGWYDRLLELDPSPVVALNRAVAVAEVDGPAAALELVDGLDLPSYAPLHAVRGDLLERLGRDAAAVAAFTEASRLTRDPVVRHHLVGRLRALDHRG